MPCRAPHAGGACRRSDRGTRPPQTRRRRQGSVSALRRSFHCSFWSLLPGARGLEPKNGRHSAVIAERGSVLGNCQQVGRLLEGKLDRGIGQVLQVDQLRAIRGAATFPFGPEPAALRTLRPRRRELLVEQE